MYKIKYRKPGQWLYRTMKLNFHQYNAQLDKMVCGMSDGSLFELPNLSKCEIVMSKATIDILDKMKKAAKPNDDVSNPQEPYHK